MHGPWRRRLPPSYDFRECNMRLVWTLIVVTLIAGVAALFGWQQAQRWLHAPITTLLTPTTYEVPRGASATAIARDLQKRGLIEYPRVFSFWAKRQQLERAVKAGEYNLMPGMSPAALLELFTSGKVILHSITFVEGSTFTEMRALLAEQPFINATLSQTSDAEIMDKLGKSGVHPEGQFFPDTYHFAKGTSDLELLTLAHARMQAELDAAWSQRAADLPLSNPYEALILASIIEKETALASERPLIAGVFVERLKRNMRLQTDPTVIYGMGTTYDGNIRRSDLQRDTPYNTYTRDGLPPTPICLPGAESLKAAVNPQITGAIFFVATGAGDGSHYFSKSLSEHNAALRRYLQALRRRAS